MFSLVFYYLICPVPKHDTVLFLYFSFRHLVLGLIGLPQNPIYDLIKDNGKKLQVAFVITISNIHVPVVGCFLVSLLFLDLLVPILTVSCIMQRLGSAFYEIISTVHFMGQLKSSGKATCDWICLT